MWALLFRDRVGGGIKIRNENLFPEYGQPETAEVKGEGAVGMISIENYLQSIGI